MTDGNVTNGTTKRIMVIDDAEALRTMLFEALSFMGYEVSSAGSGEEGVRVFLQYPFDLVITDFKMPGMDGCALSLNIKEKSPNTPVVLITGLDLNKNDIRKRPEESPVDSVILKPFKIKNLQRSVQSLLSGRTMKT
jgi:CheY-like chemotaxis protein